MTVEAWALVASVVFTGLWSGLFALLNLVMHPMLAAMPGHDFAHFLRAFLRSCSPQSASRSPSPGRCLCPTGSRNRITT